jgi:hypothetical protein
LFAGTKKKLYPEICSVIATQSMTMLRVLKSLLFLHPSSSIKFKSDSYYQVILAAAEQVRVFWETCFVVMAEYSER